MKRHAFSALLAGALGLATASGSIHAQSVDSCTVYTCMAGLSGYGTSGGTACEAALNYWHAATPAGLAVYHPYFNPGASAARRRSYLMQCKFSQLATNAIILNTIINTLGYDP